MTGGKAGRRGNAIVEFTLVGIPIIFVLISIFEISRGMWVYDSLAHAVREGTRYAIVNGRDCAKIPGCAVTIADVAQRVRETGVGLSPDLLEVTLYAMGPSAAGPVVLGTVTCSPLRTCLSRNVQPGDQWPPANANRPKVNAVMIRGIFPFRSAIAMFWPGAGRGMTFGRVRLPAMSMEVIQF
jgi:hypothetical protein